MHHADRRRGRRTDRTGPGDFTSSVSAPDIAFEKLCHLELAAGQRVFEVGSGLGFHTALLCERVGSQQVTAKEVDPGLTAAGLANLKRAGYTPAVVCGDGLEGWAQRAPFDRLISTAALRNRIPTAWREQMSDGGIIVTPFGTAYANAGLLKLTLRDGVASGRFVGGCSYMWVRSQRPGRRIGELGEARTTASALDPGEVMQGTWQQDFVVGLQVPDISFAHRGEGQDRELQLWNEPGTCVTQVRYDAWWEPGAVTVWGPRNLWDEVVGAFTIWCELGRPDITRFGLTADAHGQRLWLDNPQQDITNRL
ncbi:Protein-L-isoaspartate O-methyltransferase [Streptomyces sp. YIM 121038]|uniref:protein-L-isoaspartate O-methyltransferase family protein n=1 Tax=Streptomyces sp. YIM 121038 TaxID=2136401 RepID=UPI001162E90B|nr:protein-L-isoaspartate(D-aspartate) O-methyltransferase [Streptomyces sp. YIM 121038]QCX81763.1 Protein-L-isoaspartate O-methyltransferase [Streptomyces sp. YIM 121038]